MNQERCVVFELSGEFGHFRKVFTTTSPLTYAFPPPTALAGIIGAICGLPKQNNEYLKYFNPEKKYFAVEILNPVRKIRLGINYNNTKGLDSGKLYRIIYAKHHEGRTQIPVEFLKKPRFRIYFSTENEELLTRVSGLLRENRTVYTVSLGLAYLLAKVKFVGEFRMEEKSGDGKTENINSVVPSSSIGEGGIELEKLSGYKLGKDSTVPFSITTERKIVRFGDIIYETNAKALPIKIKKFWEVNGKKIVFL